MEAVVSTVEKFDVGWLCLGMCDCCEVQTVKSCVEL